LNIKNALEAPMADKPDFVFATYIRTTPAKLWEALTDPEMTRQYYYKTRVVTDLKPGGKFAYAGDDGAIVLDGEIVEIVPERKLVTTFKATWAPEGEPTRVMFEIEPVGDACKLTMTHFDYEKSKAGVEMGWPMIMAGLKTLLETGKPLNLPEM
jgi:uncharacterized protein YndB with AHSA1/START domain